MSRQRAHEYNLACTLDDASLNEIREVASEWGLTVSCDRVAITRSVI